MQDCPSNHYTLQQGKPHGSPSIVPSGHADIAAPKLCDSVHKRHFLVFLQRLSAFIVSRYDVLKVETLGPAPHPRFLFLFYDGLWCSGVLSELIGPGKDDSWQLSTL